MAKSKISLRVTQTLELESAFEQFIPLSKQLGQVLQEYLRYRGGESEDLLFPSETNTKLLTTSIVYDIVKYNRERGIAKTSCHLFRHTFVKNLHY